jgi:thiol-disulfide isomerase/thioredoxin
MLSKEKSEEWKTRKMDQQPHRTYRHLPRNLFISVSFFLLCATLVACSGKEEKGSKAPDFNLKDLSGKSVSLTDFRGKVVLVDFWASWCPPCRNSIPHLSSLYKNYRKRGFEILGINLDHGSVGDVMAFARGAGIEYPILIGTPEVTQKYGVNPIPASFIIDRKGNLRDKIIGFNKELGEKIDQDVKDLLEEQ